MMRKLSVLLVLLAIACKTDPGNPAGGDDNPPPPDSSNNPNIDAPEVPAGYTRLIGRNWSLPPGATDTYRCVRLTVTQDMYITEIMAQAPVGTHHTVLSFATGNAAGADGEQNCSVSTLGMVMLYASGVGTDPLAFPSNVGVKISAGQQIHLNLHLFNASDQPLSGDTAILVKSQPAPTPMLAEMVFAGKFLFQIPANNQPFTTTGGCTVNSPYTLFAVWPHQHRIGTHQKVELVRGGTPQVLHDLPFDFNEQRYYIKSPMVSVQAGDQIRVTCTWVNDTGAIVRFGESSNDEMCFSGLYRYPAANSGLFQCTDTGGAGF
jgi:hypothetical protein